MTHTYNSTIVHTTPTPPTTTTPTEKKDRKDFGVVLLECVEAPYSNGREAETQYPIGVGFLLLYIYRLSRRHRAPKDPHENNHDPKIIYKKQKGPPNSRLKIRRF